MSRWLIRTLLLSRTEVKIWSWTEKKKFDHQDHFVEKNSNNDNTAICCIPTGFGKTRLIAKIFRQRSNNAILFVPSKKIFLINTHRDKIIRYIKSVWGEEPIINKIKGVVVIKFTNIELTIASIQTIRSPQPLDYENKDVYIDEYNECAKELGHIHANKNQVGQVNIKQLLLKFHKYRDTRISLLAKKSKKLMLLSATIDCQSIEGLHQIIEPSTKSLDIYVLKTPENLLPDRPITQIKIHKILKTLTNKQKEEGEQLSERDKICADIDKGISLIDFRKQYHYHPIWQILRKIKIDLKKSFKLQIITDAEKAYVEKCSDEESHVYCNRRLLCLWKEIIKHIRKINFKIQWFAADHGDCKITRYILDKIGFKVYYIAKHIDLDPKKILRNDITLCVNKGTSGLDIEDIGIVVYNKNGSDLVTSTRSPGSNVVSDTLEQALSRCGRTAKFKPILGCDGRIYKTYTEEKYRSSYENLRGSQIYKQKRYIGSIKNWYSSITYCSDYMYKNISDILSNYEFKNQLLFTKQLKKFILPFVSIDIFRDYPDNQKTRDHLIDTSILSLIKHTFNEPPGQRELLRNLKKWRDGNFSNTELLKKPLEIIKSLLPKILKIIDSIYIENKDLLKSRNITRESGGGGVRRRIPDKSEVDKIWKSIEMGGKSLFIKDTPDNCDEVKELMHIKPKTELCSEEETSVRLVIPALSGFGVILNKYDKFNEIIYWHNDKFNIDYGKFEEFVNKDQALYLDYIRSKADILEIMERYSQECPLD